jgi:hypothetical protein
MSQVDRERQDISGKGTRQGGEDRRPIRYSARGAGWKADVSPYLELLKQLDAHKMK